MLSRNIPIDRVFLIALGTKNDTKGNVIADPLTVNAVQGPWSLGIPKKQRKTGSRGG